MNRNLGVVAAVALAGLTFALNGVSRLCAGQEAPHGRVLITQPIDETRVITLAGNTRPEANANTDRGRVADDFRMEHMLLLLKRPPELEQEFEQYIESLTDKSSPNFHHWLMPTEQGQMYGLAQADLDIVTGWLGSHGFTVGYVYPNRRVIDFSGTAGEIREVFHTEIHHLDVGGEQHFANMSDPQIPEALAPFVLGVVSMNNFKPHAYLKPRTQYQVTSGSGGTYDLVVPADVQTIYNLSPLYRQGIYGQGQTIVVVEDSMPYDTDPTTYQNTFNLGVYGGSWSNTHPNAGDNCTAPASHSSDEGEADIDVEIALAVAPGATVQAASCRDTSTFGGLIALENLVSAGSPPAVVSMSYGECEAENGQAGNAAFYSAFQSAAAAGVSVFVSSGDELTTSCSTGYNYGYFGIGVSGWASTPYNVAVGGTDFEDNYNAKEVGIPVSTYWNSTNSTIDGNASRTFPRSRGTTRAPVGSSATTRDTAPRMARAVFATARPAKTTTLPLAAAAASQRLRQRGQHQRIRHHGLCRLAKPSWQAGALQSGRRRARPAGSSRFSPVMEYGDISTHLLVRHHQLCACTYGTAACAPFRRPILWPRPPTWSGFGGTLCLGSR